MQSSKAYSAVAIGFLVTAGMLNAQTRIMVGPFVGVNYTTISGSDVKDATYKTGFAAGGQLQADFSDPLFFRTAILYSQRGAKATIEGTKVTFKENFAEIPLLLGLSFPMSGSQTKPFVMAGGQVGFKVSCDLTGSGSGTTVSLKCDDAGGKFKSTAFDAVGGGGVMFPMASGTMSVDVRYAYGLSKISDDSDAKHRGFTAGIAYMIPFGH